jgi:protein-disulfide isomerase
MLFSFPLNAADGGAPDTVIATVGTTRITLGEFERRNPTALFQARNAFYEAEKKALDSYIEDAILEEQAKKENVSVEELLKRHVYATIPPDPDDVALHVYFEGLDTTEPFETVRPKIAEHLRERRVAKARAAYLQTLHQQIPVTVRIEAPRTEISLDNTPVRGNAKSPLQLIEYADYECPYCQQIQPELARLESEYKGRMSFAFKDLPLPTHPHAQKAAEAARCAGQQSKYWEFHDLVLTTKEVEIPQLKAAARKLGMDGNVFDKCLDSGQQESFVKAQFEEAEKLGLQGTPSFFLNGRYFTGSMTYDQLREIVEAELASRGGERASQ